MNPIINLANSNNWWYNVQDFVCLNPDGITFNTIKAIQRVVYTKMSDNIGSDTMGQRTNCNFLLFKQLIPDNFIPQINSKITDANGDQWYVYDVENKYFGNVIKLFTESRAGLGVTDQQYPNGSTTTSTSTTATTPEPCQLDGSTSKGIDLISQLRMCAKDNDLVYSWFAENLALDAGQSAAISFEITNIGFGGIVDFVADAQGLLLGSAIARINGVVVGGGNFASNTLNYSTGVTNGDIVQFNFQSTDAIIKGALNVGIKLTGPTTTTTTSTSSTTTSTSSTTSTSTTPAPLVSFGFRINNPETTYINWNTLANGFSFNNIYTNATFAKNSTIDILNAGYLELTDVVLAGGAPNMGQFSYFPGTIVNFNPGSSNTVLLPTSLGSFTVGFNDNVSQTRTISQLTGSIKWYATTTTTTPVPTTTSTTTT